MAVGYPGITRSAGKARPSSTSSAGGLHLEGKRLACSYRQKNGETDLGIERRHSAKVELLAPVENEEPLARPARGPAAFLKEITRFCQISGCGIATQGPQHPIPGMITRPEAIKRFGQEEVGVPANLTMTRLSTGTQPVSLI